MPCLACILPSLYLVSVVLALPSLHPYTFTCLCTFHVDNVPVKLVTTGKFCYMSGALQERLSPTTWEKRLSPSKCPRLLGYTHLCDSLSQTGSINVCCLQTHKKNHEISCYSSLYRYSIASKKLIMLGFGSTVK